VAQLVEMLADDAATSACTGPRLAEALLSLAEHRAPTAALAVGGPGAVRRAWRLLTPLAPMGVSARLATAATVAAVVAAPLVLAVTPALLALHCNDPSAAADLVGQWRRLR
jgi:hypothetical protein